MLNDDIIRLIEQGASDQNDLLAKLKDLGHELTQSSVSRKLKQLGITKLYGKYHLSKNIPLHFKQEVIFSFAAPNLLILRTAPGHASTIAALLDGQLINNNKYPEFIGTIAGDDTIFLAIDLGDKSSAWAVEKLKSIIG